MLLYLVLFVRNLFFWNFRELGYLFTTSSQWSQTVIIHPPFSSMWNIEMESTKKQTHWHTDTVWGCTFDSTGSSLCNCPDLDACVYFHPVGSITGWNWTEIIEAHVPKRSLKNETEVGWCGGGSGCWIRLYSHLLCWVKTTHPRFLANWFLSHSDI